MSLPGGPGAATQPDWAGLLPNAEFLRVPGNHDECVRPPLAQETGAILARQIAGRLPG